MTDALVSIIIPFYNEEKFLRRAALSALRQSYHAARFFSTRQINIVSFISNDRHQVGRIWRNGTQVLSHHCQFITVIQVIHSYPDHKSFFHKPDMCEDHFIVQEQGDRISIHLHIVEKNAAR